MTAKELMHIKNTIEKKLDHESVKAYVGKTY